MNATLHDNDASIHYYDSDYPSADHCRFPENLDAITALQGVANDVDRYMSLASEAGDPILEVGCGTGRIAIALARAGHQVHAIDISGGMLEIFRSKLKQEPESLRQRITIEQADATDMVLSRADFRLALLPFNTLPCIPDFDQQRAVLRRIHAHLVKDGRLIIDLISPFRLKPAGDPIPKPFFTRRNEWTGRIFTRFAMLGPMDEHQRQELTGWYDEVRDDSTVERRYYSIVWRPIYRYEIQLMLEDADFSVAAVEGDHHAEPFNAKSSRMFIRAICHEKSAAQRTSIHLGRCP